MKHSRGDDRRAGIATVILLALLPMSACSLTIPEGSGSEPGSSASTAPESSTKPSPAPSAAGFTFEDGASLSAANYIEWADGLFGDDGWTLTSPDDGNGNWGYTSIDGACTVAFWQGRLDGLTPAGDDSVDSDAVIAFFVNAERQQITDFGYDEELSYQIAGAGGLEARAILSEEDDRTWILAARAFGSAGVGLYTLVDCTGGDAQATFDEVVEKNAILIN